MNPEVLAWAQAQTVGTAARTLLDAYLLGALRVTIDGKTVEYRSAAEMERVLVLQHSATLAASTRRPGFTLVRFGGS